MYEIRNSFIFSYNISNENSKDKNTKKGKMQFIKNS